VPAFTCRRYALKKVGNHAGGFSTMTCRRSADSNCARRKYNDGSVDSQLADWCTAADSAVSQMLSPRDR
jgi:hypothetical protein